jgi:lipoprotein NlpD
MKISVVVFVLLIAACSKRHPAPVRDINQSGKINSGHPLSKQHKFKSKYVHVKKGDTLYSLGFSHNIDFKTLAKINHIKSPYRIYPGQKLRLYAEKNVKKNIEVINKKAKNKQQSSVIKTKPAIKVVNNNKPPITQPTKEPIQKSQPAPAANNRWIWPVKGKIISTFSNTDTSRKGIDIASSLNSDVYASNNGTVVYSGDGLLGYGELIIIKHSNNLLSAYAHNSKRLVKEGQSIKQGAVIAKTGKGTDGKPLLHFEIRKKGQPVNPLSYLPKQ